MADEPEENEDLADIKSILTFILIFFLVDSLIFSGYLIFMFLHGSN